MMVSFQVGGLRYNDKTSAIGAQTERRGMAGPGRDLLGGETSPAALLVTSATAVSAVVWPHTYFLPCPGRCASTASASAWNAVSSSTRLGSSRSLFFWNHCLPRSKQ